MAVVQIRINGREYGVACDDGQEEHLRLLADDVDERVRSLVFGSNGAVSESMALLLAALMMSDELIESKKEIEKLTAGASRQLDPRGEARMAEIESAMAGTLDEIASRIERIADSVEIR